MPRTKLVMKLIENPKKRRATYKNRREGLVHKVSQLASLCDIDAFLICFGPAAVDGVVTTWPPDRHAVRSLIRRYRAVDSENKTRQNVNTTTFLQDELAKQQRKLLKVAQCGADDVLTPWDCRLDDLAEPDLRRLLTTLDLTLQRTRQRIAVLGGHVACNDGAQLAVPAFAPLLAPARPHIVFGQQCPYSFLDGSDVGGQYYYHDIMLQSFPPPYLHYQTPSSTSNAPSEYAVVNGTSILEPLPYDLPYSVNVDSNANELAGFDKQYLSF